MAARSVAKSNGFPGAFTVASLVERAADLVYRYRLWPNPGFDYVSPAATRITGYTPEEHYADPSLGVRIVHPADRARSDAALREPSSAPLRLRWRRKDGTVVWTEQRNVPVFEDGRLVAVEGIAREIPPPGTDGVRTLGGLHIDLVTDRVRVDGKPVRLTPTEFRLLVLLSEVPGAVVTRRAMAELLWGGSSPAWERSCFVHVSNLRSKIERNRRKPEWIRTVRGEGYRLVAA